MNLNFRSALNGFNRQDVANYLEYLNNRHNTEITQLNTDLEALRQQQQKPQIDPQKLALEARCMDLQEKLAQAERERDSARQERDEALAREQAAKRQLEDAQRARDEAVIQASGAKLDTNQELEAYRRAERAERVARERAELVYSETGAVLTQASTRVESALRQMNGISQQVTSHLDTLQTAISASRMALQDAADTIQRLKPNR
ncbi:MAG: hypothetical protein SOZ90_02540 [Candidatus Faecousia sp.]|nr:hypothetical protein [Candidatus Faecousia sp.]